MAGKNRTPEENARREKNPRAAANGKHRQHG